MTKKWNLVIDINRCNGCYNCALAAKDEYVDNREPGYFEPMPRHSQEWVDVIHHERGQFPAIDVAYVPVMCNHCDDAPCLKAAKNGAVTKREDGIVLIDPVKAKGQKQIVEACPYGAVFWNDELQIPQNWPFDAHLLDRGWKSPRAVEVCATGAISAHKLDDNEMLALAQTEKLAVRGPEYKTSPRVYYKNLDRVQKQFIAGSVVVNENGIVECAVDATATLTGAGISLVAKTDDFGDFRFDGLPLGGGSYQISIKRGAEQASVTVEQLDKSVYTGKLLLIRE